TKGLLIPRMTTAQRIAIVSPASSLLVYDTNLSSFFYWTGTGWTKIGTSSSDYWLPDGNNIYFNAGNVGVGTSSPGRKMIVKGSSVNLNEAIFAVQNTDGDTVFAVYPEGVRVWVNDDGGSKASGNRGGFAVGGYSPSKAGFTNEYLRVTPDSVRVYIDDDFIGSKASGNRGGFAVGGFCPSKGTNTDHYLFVQDDSTRVYVADSTQGFGVENIEAANNSRIMKLTTENYLIGHESGISIVGGLYNSFMGYKTGHNSTTASNNVFLGYESGYSNTTGNYNTFLGFQAGYTNAASYNTFLGYQCGKANTTGSYNAFMGYNAGLSNTNGLCNVFFGYEAGRDNSGEANVFIGSKAGQQNSTGLFSVMIGESAGFRSVGGEANVFIGCGTGALTEADNNTFVGGYCGGGITTGYNNTFVGAWAGGSVTSGNNNTYLGFGTGNFVNASGNTFVGFESGGSKNSGGNNLFLGSQAGYNNLSGIGNVFIGYQTGYNETGNNKLYIDNSIISTPLIYGDFNTDFVKLNAAVCIRDLFSIEKESNLTLGSGGTVTPVKSYILIGSTTPIVLNGVNAITDGTLSGQVLLLEGSNNINTITINDGANTQMSGNVVLGLYDTIMFIWNGTDWIEISRTNN
ncbi:MAG: hypothetical protein ABIJ97_14100, partial [Bacteroidota bacterium]